LIRVRHIAALLLLLIAPAIARAQPTSEPTSQPGDQLRVFLLTFGPGTEAWEKFGHDAIAITDLSTGESTAYNWGVFNFGQGWTGFTSFAWHFLQGRLMYAMESEPTVDMLEEYKETSRSILAQELNLTAAQKQALQRRLIANDTDANRWYLYDYFQKNCATMARDAIDQTVNGRVRTALNAMPTATTYRWHDRRTTAGTLWLYLFLDFALGQPIDRPLSAWQECFLPGQLAKHLTIVKVPDESGNLVPLVSDSRLLNEGTFPERATPPASFIYGFLAAGVCVGLALAALGWLGHRHTLARWAFNFFAALWSLLAGALGALLTFAWFTNHAAAKWNENWLQANPISLLLVVLIPAAWHWPRAAKKLTIAVLALSAFGFVSKITPWASQSNWPTIAIALPIHVAIAWGILLLARSTEREPISHQP
jgi:hypothetical protein